MGLGELLLLALGVSMDAFAVSICKGLAMKKATVKAGLTCGIWFGGFQALMPIIGYFLGRSFALYVVEIDHWLAFGLLTLIGLNMIREAIWGDDEAQDANFGFRTMLLMAIATSIDALAVGISMAFIGANIWISATVIGVVTLLLSAIGVYLGKMFGSRLGSKAGIVGGIILITIGIKILVEHLSM